MKVDDGNVQKLIGAAGTLGSCTILKAIGKFVPGIGQFVSGAFTAGYAADQILDFVKDKLESPAARRNRMQLQSRAEQGVARPDEQASLSQMEQQRAPMEALGGLGKLGAQAIGGVASARAGAAQQANDQALQQGQIQAQEAATQQRQAQGAAQLQQRQAEQAAQMQQKQQAMQDAQQRQAQQDQLATIQRQQSDIRRKEDLEFKKRAEERAIEKHKAALSKPNIKQALKNPIVKSHEDVLKELYELINKAP